MGASLEAINSVQKRIKITVDATKVDTAFTKAYNDIKKKAKIQGFRPGKAPLNMIKKLYGASVASQVGEDLINGNLFESIKENEIQLISSPVIEATSLPEAGKEYEFAAVIDIMPTIELKNYKDLSVEIHQYGVDEKAVENELKTLARKHAKSLTIDDANVTVDKGHLATISHVVSLNGEKLEQMDVNKVSVAIGEQELYPDLETAIIGMKKGESKDVDIKLPETFDDSELAGKTANFTITLDDLSTLETPAIDDDFAKDIGYDSKDALETEIRNSLKTQSESAKRRELEGKLMAALLEKNSFDVPPVMIDEVIDSMINEMYPGKSEPAKAAKNNPEIRANLKNEAKKRAQNTLLLWEIAKIEKIEVVDADINNHIKKILGKLDDDSEETKQQVAQFSKSVGAQIKDNLLLEKCIDLLISHAKITEMDHAPHD